MGSAMNITSALVAAGVIAFSASLVAAQTSPVPTSPQGKTPAVTEPKAPTTPSNEPLDAGAALPKVEPLKEVPPVLEVIDSTVFAVRVVGPWRDGDLQGFSRVVLVAEGDTPRLFVQWMEQPGEGEPTVKATAEMTQVAEEKLVFGDIRAEASQNDASVFLDTRVDVQGFKETYVLHVGPPGRARFGSATN